MAREHYLYKGTAAVIFMGYGVGMGLVIDGKTYHGSTGAAAEFGHMNHIPYGAMCRCGMEGCIEAYASDYGILRTAQGLPANTPPPLDAVEPEVMLALEASARQGDGAALAAYAKAGQAIGFGLARMIALLSPDRIIISGPGIRAFDLAEPAIAVAIEEGVVTALRQNVKLEKLPMDHDMIITGERLTNYCMTLTAKFLRVLRLRHEEAHVAFDILRHKIRAVIAAQSLREHRGAN